MSGQPSDDAAAVEESLRQPEAFARLYDQYAKDIHRYAMRRIGAEAADDVTSETFLVAFRARSRFNASAVGARPWLYGIAAKLIGRRRRSEIRMLRAYARTGSDPVVESWVEHADNRVVAQGVQQQLAGALAELSAGDRHVLLLVAWAEFTYQEVADALGIPLGTVRSRLNRARRKLRTALGADPALVVDAMEVARNG
ncbi:RNA polymerase sigma factor [Streptomyces sp. NPDC001381]|uniref:RNA polymerase sigma factor n=1 Tax=Streptomyces sp. NPDC001381 TaxID=3364567 RepID=UPI0036A1E173